MKPIIGRSAIAAIVAFAALSAPIQAAEKYGVKDDAKFFTPAAVEKANQKLEELSKKYGANFRIETIVLPAEQKAQVDKLKKPEQGKHFKSWATKRFGEYGVGERGAYILVVKSPGQVQAHIGDEVGAKFFDESNRKKLVDQMVADLSAAKGKAADPALDHALAMFSEGASKLSPVATTKPGPTAATTSGVKETAGKAAESVKNTTNDVIDNAKKDVTKGKEAVQGMSTSTLIILGVVVLLVLLFALKGLFGGGKSRPTTYAPPPPQGNYGGQGGAPSQGMNQPLGYGRPQSPPPPQGYPQQGYPQQGGYPQQPPQAGGGGFMKGMLGGMLGGAAGAYMYDKMSGGHAHGGTPAGGGNAGGAPTGGGGDYGASGDFSETGPAGGGDYGASGDFGGDDAAATGGDYGASGDFAEASGGDYGASGDFGGDEAGGGGGDYGASGDFGGDDGGGGSGDFDDET